MSYYYYFPLSFLLVSLHRFKEVERQSPHVVPLPNAPLVVCYVAPLVCHEERVALGSVQQVQPNVLLDAEEVSFTELQLAASMSAPF